MHPAFSVIFFTTASGAGYGLLALLGILAPSGLLPDSLWFGIVSLTVALALITAGLFASTAHLGHPERAWRAISQWRTSWLSREGLAAIATYVPALLFGLGWLYAGRAAGAVAVLGIASAVMAAMTVWCTAMIYASLKPIHQWCNGLVAPNYLALSLMTGALWLQAFACLWTQDNALASLIAAIAVVPAALLKFRYWQFIDTTRAVSSVASATGLKGRVRFLDGPHTEESYLLKEMGYRIARKHATKLRRIAAVLAFAVPFVLSLLAFFASGVLATIAAIAAVVLAMAGVLIERWLFFAEAKHSVMLYYGAESV
jgi:sulfite dehydrogenase (quinone) subunit SoeC